MRAIVIPFDSGADDSYVSSDFCALFDQKPETLGPSFEVVVATCGTAIVDKVYKGVKFRVG